jgi:peptidoglycan/LPS O-acetylase OafA/YrhL
MVMQYHFWGLSFGVFAREPTLAVDGWAEKAMGFGWISVDLFFVLSGFLITGILLDVKGRAGFFRNFYARRALRIMPVYYLYLIFVIVLIPLVPWFPDGFAAVAQADRLQEDQIWFWTYTLNIATSFDAIAVNPPTVHLHFWTLSVEEQFYLVWPFIVLMLSARRLGQLCVIMIMVAFVFRFAVLEGVGDSFLNPNAASVMTPAKMDALAIGSLVALAVRNGNIERIAPYALHAIGSATAILLFLFIRNDGLTFNEPDTVRWGYTALAFLFAAAIVILVRAPAGSLHHRIFASRPFVAFGTYSYTMYVVHLLVAFELARQFAVHDLLRTTGGSQIPLNLIYSLVATSITFAIAWTTWRVLEFPILSQKKRFRYGRTPSVVGEPPATSPALRGAE